MSEINRLFYNINSGKESLLDAQENFDVGRSDIIRNRVRLRSRITGLWLVVSVAGGYYVWSNGIPPQEGQSLFSALARRSWTRLELAVTAGYGVLFMAMQANGAIADLCYGPLQEADLNKELDELSTQMSEYLTFEIDEENRVPVDRLQHLLSLNIDSSELLSLIDAALGEIGTVVEEE